MKRIWPFWTTSKAICASSCWFSLSSSFCSADRPAADQHVAAGRKKSPVSPFIWFILFGACYATRLCALNRVTLQFSRAPKWVGNLFLFIGDIIWLCFSLIMAWEGYIAVLDLVEFRTQPQPWTDLGMVYLSSP